MNPEYSNLLSEIKDQVLYLRELGVTGLDVVLPEIKLKEVIRETVSTGKQSVPHESEYFVPDDVFLKQVGTQSNEEPIRPAAQPKSESRLSRIPTLTNRPAPANYQTPIQQIPVQMAKKTSEPTPTQILFGDMSQTLPISGETVPQIHDEIGDCKRCELCTGRTNIAHSTGNLQADLMFVGEAPGADEDEQGKPFVGRAGQLLTKIIEAIGMTREEVFIGNINRCRPPGNRQPTPVESETCKPFLLREIAVVRPKVIVVLGNTACQNLLETKVGITKLRGNFQDYYGVKVMPTFHPAYLLRDPHKKREVWEDMKKVRDYLNTLT